MRIELVEMEQVPGWARTERRVTAPFGGSWKNATDLMERELGHLGVDLLVIELSGPRVKIRQDGWLHSNSLVDPPVAISAETKDHGLLAFRSDRYDWWVSNVHAVGLTLERLRAVERYGCTDDGQQYQGWAQLPEGGDVQAAEYWIATFIGWTVDQFRHDHRGGLRAARIKSHPDRNQGRTEASDTLHDCMQVLGLEF